MSHKADYYFMHKGKLTSSDITSLSITEHGSEVYSTQFKRFYRRMRSSWITLPFKDVSPEFKTLLLLEGILGG